MRDSTDSPAVTYEEARKDIEKLTRSASRLEKVGKEMLNLLYSFLFAENYDVDKELQRKELAREFQEAMRDLKTISTNLELLMREQETGETLRIVKKKGSPAVEEVVYKLARPYVTGRSTYYVTIPSVLRKKVGLTQNTPLLIKGDSLNRIILEKAPPDALKARLRRK